jgi:hypothetical protein
MGLPIGLENEKIKNVLSITPFGASGGTSNQPTAHTVSSADELPSDAVDGSLAIVVTEIHNDGKAFIFQEDITIPAELYDNSYYLDFTVNTIDGRHLVLNRFYFWDDGSGISYYGDDDGVEEAYVVGMGWNGGCEAIRIIKPSDDADFNEWLNESKLQGSLGGIRTEALYSHKNGEWVYKCEVA